VSAGSRAGRNLDGGQFPKKRPWTPCFLHGVDVVKVHQRTPSMSPTVNRTVLRTPRPSVHKARHLVPGGDDRASHAARPLAGREIHGWQHKLRPCATRDWPLLAIASRRSGTSWRPRIVCRRGALLVGCRSNIRNSPQTGVFQLVRRPATPAFATASFQPHGH
jgi:hypothetical protein